jgi:hypothetical protein
VKEGLQGKVPRRFKQTTDSQHDDPIAANLLDRDFTAAAPNPSRKVIFDVSSRGRRAETGWCRRPTGQVRPPTPHQGRNGAEAAPVL